MKYANAWLLAFFFVVGLLHGQNRRDASISQTIEANRQTYKEADTAIVTCIYRVEQEQVNNQKRRAVIWVTVTEVLKGDLKKGERLKLSKYYDSSAQSNLEPGALHFLLLPKIEKAKEIVASSGEMPAYSEELHKALKQATQ